MPHVLYRVYDTKGQLQVDPAVPIPPLIAAEKRWIGRQFVELVFNPVAHPDSLAVAAALMHPGANDFAFEENEKRRDELFQGGVETLVRLALVHERGVQLRSAGDGAAAAPAVPPLARLLLPATAARRLTNDDVKDKVHQELFAYLNLSHQVRAPALHWPAPERAAAAGLCSWVGGPVHHTRPHHP